MAKNIITSAVLVLFLTLGFGVDASAQSSNEFCWKDSYGRGVGTVPKACKSNQDRIGLLCYNKCPRGQKRFGFDCHSVCPSGMRDDGLFCRKAEYGRGAGYPWKFGDALNDSGMFKRCERKHGKRKCEKWGAVVYPKCKKGYKPFGCCICRPSVPNCKKLGLKPGIDLSCAKVVNVVGPQTGICGRGQQKDAGLCYKNCRSGYTGVGPVCWNKSPKGFVDCGMGAAKNSKICASVTSNQVISVGFLALNVATMGGSSAAQKSTKASKFAALKKKWEAFEKTKSYKRAAEAAKRAGQANNFYKAGKNIKTASTPEDKARAAANLAAVLDPTGVADVVGAFTYPKCSKMVAANPSMFKKKPAKAPPKQPKLTNLKFPTVGNRSLAIPQCIQAEKTLRSKRMLNRAGTLIKNDCAVMYRKKWLKGKGKNNPRVCRPAWNALFKSKALGATKILVTKKCPIIYANRWRKQTNFHMPKTGGSIAGKVARLKVQHSNQCVDVSGGSKKRGQRLIQWSCHKGANQRFKLEPRGKGFYRIRAQHSKQCLDIRGGSKKRGADLIQWSCHNGPNQQWRLESAGGGWYRIKARHSNQCLDVSGGSKKRGQKLIQWPCHKGANQKFRLN